MNIAKQFGVTQKGGDPKLKQPLLRDGVTERDVTRHAKPVTGRDVRDEAIADLIRKTAALEARVRALELSLLSASVILHDPSKSPRKGAMTAAERAAAYRARRKGD